MSFDLRTAIIVSVWGLTVFACSGADSSPVDAGHRVPDGSALPDAAPTIQDSAPSYEVVSGWPELEPGTMTGQVSGVVVAGADVLVFHRADRPWFGGTVSATIEKPTLFWLGTERGEIRARAGAGQFTIPHGLRRASNGNLWVTDVGTHKVHELSADGKVLRSFGTGMPGSGRETFDGPTDVYVAPEGSIYVADGYGNHRVVKLSAAGEYELEWGSAGSGPGQFETPHSIAADTQGRIYVADRGNSRIQRFDADGNFIDAWQSAALGRPWAVTIAEDGFVYSVDGGDQTSEPPDRAGVVKLDQEGVVLARWSVYGNADGELNWPHAVAVGVDGSVYVGEVRGGSRVQKFVAR